jgi:hypothetical protein
MHDDFDCLARHLPVAAIGRANLAPKVNDDVGREMGCGIAVLNGEVIVSQDFR